MDARQERIGRNEALFREVNERLRDIGESFSVVAEVGEFVCECGSASCVEPIRMPLDEYERIRAEPNRFFVRTGHVIEDVERVVESRAEYDIVEKFEGGPARLARETDPRDDDEV